MTLPTDVCGYIKIGYEYTYIFCEYVFHSRRSIGNFLDNLGFTKDEIMTIIKNIPQVSPKHMDKLYNKYIKN